MALGLLVAAYAGVLELSRPHVSGKELRYDQFVALAGGSQIKDAKLLDEDAYVVGTYVDGGTVRHYNAPLLRGSQPELLNLLLANRIPITIDQQVGKRVAALASILLPGLILVVLFVYLILSYRRGTGLFGIKSGARQITPEEGHVTFADVAGQDAAVSELREIKEFLTDPDRFSSLGARVPKGILLYGPPGCGKTLIAKALAGEAGAAFFSISGSDFVELYVGVGAARVRDLFREAREHAPALVFIDELDSVGRARGGMAAVAGHGEQEQALNQILAEMDGFSPSEGIIVLGATNRPDVLDPALLRPGRFDRTVGLERPDEAARLAILSLHARDKRLEPGVDLAAIALRAIGLTGADLASVMNEGALLAARAGEGAVSQVRLEQALQRILQAPERQRRLSLRDRSIAKRYAAEDRVTFADVAGADDAVAELAEVKDYLATPERFADMGARVPKGILLSGPPGCGKTLLARAVAGEANAAFFSVAGSEFVELFAGEGAGRVRDLFAEARSVAPAIVFIDEIDAIGSRRGPSLDGHREREQTLNQILVELDGFEASSGVTVIAATNRPDILDPALVRPGRFDRHVTISPPDRAGRRAILDLHAQGKRLGPDVDLDSVAGLTRGFSGADLANVLNEAALLAARAGKEQIPMSLVEEGIDRAWMGVASRATILSEDERRVVAYHEAGHALVARGLPGASVAHKVTIVARGVALGHCSLSEPHDQLIRPRSMLLNQMAAGLGGRAAEDLVFGEPGSGAANDLRWAGGIARRMVCELGMSTVVGLVPYGDGLDPDTGPRSYSEQTTRAIDAEVRSLMDEAYGRARAVLEGARAALDRVAHALLDKESLSLAELEQLTGTQPGSRRGRSAKAATTAARSQS
ncbi:MAG TPA: ATP-dependent zinc metalloprotease FtsH [Acidimicrobiales bacterium]|nr:ATP-dependent zinc metalloprotease FtsH [Acidimicrobiales bacterium]